jgi:diguanylate cyclase (GGDEF)-like protein
MVWDRRRLSSRLVSAARAIRDYELHTAALGADKQALELDLGVAGRLADWRAFHDDLTALPNRALLLDRLGQALAREGAVAVLVCDLDGLRVVNDTMDRTAGDAVLVEVADRLTMTVRPGDTVARVGGDEFVVVAEGLFEDQAAADLAERIRDSLAAPLTHRRESLRLSVSIGIAVAQGGTAEEALRDADAALYRAKERGRDRYEFFTGRMPSAGWGRNGSCATHWSATGFTSSTSRSST